MSGFFHGQDDPWFRIGRLSVTSTMIVVLAGLFGMLAWVAVPALPGWLAYAPSETLTGQVWRPFTWPLADWIDIWSLLTLFFLWYFGTDLERAIGRKSMAWFYLGIWASLTAAATIVAFFMPSAGIAGLRLVEFAVLLVWIAEYPKRLFFFAIPAWVVGVVFLALQVLPLIAMRAWSSLVQLLLALGFVAMAARANGLLSDYRWIPGAKRARSRPKPRTAQASRTHQRQQHRRASDEERIDQLLDKISAHGMHSLTKSERAELEKLRQRRR